MRFFKKNSVKNDITVVQNKYGHWPVYQIQLYMIYILNTMLLKEVNFQLCTNVCTLEAIILTVV